MCGIVGYVGSRQAAPVVVAGLQRLEYRGYDSAGLAVVDAAGALQVRRQAGKLANLVAELLDAPVVGSIGIGHTRWATHGPPSQRNAHPHCSPDGRLAVVQNGIVENFTLLRSYLRGLGYTFVSDTDTEVIAHLIHHHYINGSGGDLTYAVRQAVLALQGPNAIVVLSTDVPDRLIAARLGNAGGVAIGQGVGEMLVASDLQALVGHTGRVTFLESRQMATLTAHGALYSDLEGRPVELVPLEVDWAAAAVEKGAYRHYMQKEIYEQGASLTDCLRGRIDFERQQVVLDSLRLSPAQAQALTKVTIVACGTSYYAGLAGKTMIEQLAGVPVEVDYSSEFRYRQPLVRPDHLVLAITQSGETVDTLAALEEARARGARTAAIVNAVGSQAARVCDGVIYMQAGPEIGVASTKAFTASLLCLYCLGLYLAQMRASLTPQQVAAQLDALVQLPGQVGDLLAEARRSGYYQQLAGIYAGYANFLYLGRGIHYAVAREGALKLKEISYIHAEGYPAGEMKHGPIALIDASFPTVVLAPRDPLYDKMVSQIEQIKARGGKVLAVAHADDSYISAMADHLLPIPRSHPLLLPVLAVIPLQLLAYEMALQRGTDVDQPRNLAKSVTVE